jgi:hypothetical protein
MIDVDCVEFDGTTPILACELKHGNVQEIDTKSYQFKCYCSIFSCPVVALVYWHLGAENNILHAEDTISKVCHTQYLAIPINEPAMKILENQPQKITEWDWIRFLHHLRHKPVSVELNKKDFSTEWRDVKIPNIKQWQEIK